MTSRIGKAVIWAAAGFLLGFAALAGGQGDEDLREKLIELEALSAKLRSLDRERGEVPAPTEQGLAWECIPIPDLCAAVPDWIGPRRFVESDEEAPLYSGPSQDTTQHYGTIEEIIEIVRTTVHPEAWETGSQMSSVGPTLLLLTHPDTSRAVRDFIDKELRPDPRRTVNLEVEIVEAGEPVASALVAAVGSPLDPAERGRLDEAIGAGKARRIFAGRVLALSRQQVVLWHGAQIATVPDADVEVGPGSQCSDPVVDIELLGTSVQARSTVGEDPARVRVRLVLHNDEMDRPVRTAETEGAGALQMPARATMEVDAELWTLAERWAVAAERTGPDGKRRFVLVRPTVIGGAR
jgi:hypothetical protein